LIQAHSKANCSHSKSVSSSRATVLEETRQSIQIGEKQMTHMKNQYHRIFLLVLALALFGLIFLSACGGDNGDAGGADTVAIRQPEGDVETFWDSFDWAELNAAEQAAPAQLGYTQPYWDATE
jgi:hypothetical protein